jgi:ABC-type lipoprotein release transport system permease subunit
MILEFALSSLCRRKYKNLALLFAFSLLVFILSSILLLTHALKREAIEILQGAPEITVQRVIAGRQELIPIEYADKIRTLPGVGKIEPRYWGYYYDPFIGANYTLLGLNKDILRTLKLLEGRSFTPNQKGVCIIGRGVAKAYFAEVGDRITIIGADGSSHTFKVVGIFKAESDILTNDLIILSTDEIKRLFQIPEGLATDIVVEVYNPEEIDIIAQKIKKLFPSTRPITRKEILRTYESLFDWRSGMILTMFIAAVVAFVILAWDKATGLSAEERREIGILKAIGWESSDIMELKFWEGFVLSSLSFFTGLIGGYIHVFLLGAPLLSTALKGWSVVFPTLRLTPYVSIYQLLVLMFLTVVPYMASTIVPSWKAAMTEPDQVMRG